ncbi:hypothetical protein Taro_019092 [Colocasia esculenta]|uniref:Uncharacterized protein n=1 Tax=Colocasia esculenta TaxID=4460 RepID=A0A843V141_COLES|nr:hypothetical protein [Colocasia esculenta]
MAFSCSTSLSPAFPSSRLRSFLHPRRSLSAFRPPPPELGGGVPRSGSVVATTRAPFAVRAMAADAASPDVRARAGVPVYKPRSYEVLVSDAARSLVYALDDGKTRLEIDFPLVVRSCSSAVCGFLGVGCEVFPDQPEKRRASQLFKTALDMISNASIGSLDDVPAGPVSNFFKSIRNTLDFDFAGENEGLFWKL